MRLLRLTISIIILCAVCGVALAVPGPPTVMWPANGAVCGSNRPDIIWTGDTHTAYEVHIGYYNVPTSTEGWDSNPVISSENLAMCGSLQPGRNYFVFVRLQDSNGWGPWSAAGRYFYTGGQLMNEPYNVGDPVGGQWPHSICYNPDLNQYLIAFNDNKSTPWIISYYILNGNGEKISSEFSLPHSLEGAHAAATAYDSVHKEYLIAFTGWNSAGGIHDELWVRRVRASDGTPLGANIWIRNAGMLGDSTLPLDAAYSTASDVYFVVWREWNGADSDKVFGARLAGGTAASAGSIVEISAGQNVPCGNPAVVYNPTVNEFFVIYQPNNYLINPLTYFDYSGQRIRASDGQLLGSSVTIAKGPWSEAQGDVSYDSDLNRYLVVYQSGHDGKSIWGQFVRADGVLIDPDGTPLSAQNPFAIVDQASTGLTCWGPQVAWNPNTKEYLVCFCDSISYEDYGRRLAQDGSSIGTPFNVVGSVLGIGNWLPTPMANPVSNEFIIAWYNSYNDVYTRRYKPGILPSPDTIPPGKVAGLTVTPGDQQNTLTWTNPSDSDFAGVLIRFAVGSYPNGPEDGQLLANVPNIPGSTDAFTHSNLNGGATYYYSLFAYDEVPNYTTAVKATGTPAGPRVFSTSAFNSGTDGWSTSVWKSGSFDFGTMSWNSSAGSSGGGMRCIGAGASDNEFRETREGGEMWKTISTTHYQNIRVTYDVRVSPLGGAWYGVGTGGSDFSVDHNDIQEQLSLLYSVDGGVSWNEVLPWIGRNTLSGYQTYGTRQIDLSSIPEVGNNPSFTLKFRWQLNQATDIADLDNIIISGSQMESVSPGVTVTSPTSASHCPANVKPFAVSGVASDNVGVTQVIWSSNRGGNGTCAVSLPGERSVYWDANVDLQPGQNMLTFTARDLAGNARSDTLMIAYSPDAPASIGDSKKLSDNSLAYLSTKTVTAVFSDHFYIEEPGRSAGIRVKPYSMLSDIIAGKSVDASGALRTETNGERYLYGSALVVGQAVDISPVGLSSRYLGGSNWFFGSGASPGQSGIEDGLGLSNIGVLVTIWGKITQRDAVSLQYFYVDDGYQAIDGTQTTGVPNVGVRVKADPTIYPVGSYVSITGISTCFKDSSGKLRRQVVPKPDGIRTF